MEYRVTLEEFTAFHPNPTLSQLNRLIRFHLFPLNQVREELGFPIFIRSGIRSEENEAKNSRSGKSEHCYLEDGKGATDVSTTKSSSVKADPDLQFKLAQKLVQAGFVRICFYPKSQFFHVDYKGAVRSFFTDNEDGKGWKNATPEEFYREVSRG